MGQYPRSTGSIVDMAFRGNCIVDTHVDSILSFLCCVCSVMLAGPAIAAPGYRALPYKYGACCVGIHSCVHCLLRLTHNVSTLHSHCCRLWCSRGPKANRREGTGGHSTTAVVAPTCTHKGCSMGEIRWRSARKQGHRVAPLGRCWKCGAGCKCKMPKASSRGQG